MRRLAASLWIKGRPARSKKNQIDQTSETVG
jgi:hypothetical protein